MAKYFGLRGQALNNALIWAVVMPAYLLFGYNNAVAGGLLSLPTFNKVFPSIDTAAAAPGDHSNRAQIQGTVVACYTLGALFGALSCIFLGDKLGRKKTIMTGAAVTCLGSAIQSCSYSLGQLIVGRVVTGLGFGAISATTPNWQTECSRAGHRGFVVMLESFFISAGLAIAGWLEFGLSHVNNDVNWRFPLAFSCFFAVILLFSMPFWPESPRWLIKKGYIEEAKEVMSALDDIPIDSPEVIAEVREIELSLEETGKGRFRDIFRNGPGRFGNRAFIAAATQVFQQFSGINAIAFYQDTIFQKFLHLDGNISRILSACVFTWQTICSPIGILTIEKGGRRKLMMFGATGMGIVMALIAGLTSQSHNTSAIDAATVFIFFFSTFFVTGYLGLAFLYSSEISPLSVRTPITALSTCMTWLSNFVVVEITPTGFQSIGWRYFIVFACINLVLILPTVYLFFPETQGLHLEAIDRIFLESKNIFQPVVVAKRVKESSEEFFAPGVQHNPEASMPGPKTEHNEMERV